MRVLIPTYPQDAHAFEVALVLEDLGHEAVLWHGGDFPTRALASLELSAGGELACEISGAGPMAGPPFDVVWLRRPTPAALPQGLHPADRPVAERECRDFLGGLYHLLAPEAFWVNPLAGRQRSEVKAVQLYEATRAGLAIPPTLMSNDPERIRRFLAGTPEAAIYKPFTPAEWEGRDGSAVLWTTEVTAEELPRDEILRLTPGIFQARVPKAHELRVTILGRHVVTARLLSQQSDAGRLDWRAAGNRLQVEPDRLPEGVEAACLRLMENLGLLYGAFDFVVTPAGEHVFLEVNPGGQFLWVEESNPEIPLLAPFVDFLLSRDPAFRWHASAGHPRHSDWYPRAVERIREEAPLHVAPEAVYIGKEDGDETVEAVSRH